MMYHKRASDTKTVCGKTIKVELDGRKVKKKNVAIGTTWALVTCEKCLKQKPQDAGK